MVVCDDLEKKDFPVEEGFGFLQCPRMWVRVLLDAVQSPRGYFLFDDLRNGRSCFHSTLTNDNCRGGLQVDNHSWMHTRYWV